MELPAPIAAFFEAFNAHDVEAVAALFTAAALVDDEENQYHGPAGVVTWANKVHAAYAPQAQVTGVAREGETITVTAQVSGTFPGSPLQLRYHFRLEGDRIATLTCGV